MIISASRRTDIPAFFAEWFLNRTREGFAVVPNPMNSNQLSLVSLLPEDVTGIVFWTKNAAPLVGSLDELDVRGYRYSFQYTITSYPRVLEPGSPTWEASVDTFRRVSRHVGPQRVAWRYDPILFTPALDVDYHLAMIARTAAALESTSEQLVISFVDVYRKVARNLKPALGVVGPELGFPADGSLESFAQRVVEITSRHGFSVQTCAESIDLSSVGVLPGRCIDADLFSSGVSRTAPARKDKGQREACGCAPSRDIGMYDSCLHGCTFCYANTSGERALKNRRELHDPNSPVLLGTVDADVLAALRAPKASQSGQMRMGI